jgi:hypothetical protein
VQIGDRKIVHYSAKRPLHLERYGLKLMGRRLHLWIHFTILSISEIIRVYSRIVRLLVNYDLERVLMQVVVTWLI